MMISSGMLPLKDITLHNDGAKVSPRFAYAIGEDYSAGAWDAKATLVKGMPKKEKNGQMLSSVSELVNKLQTEAKVL